MPSLTDRQRVELAVPCYLAFQLVVAGCFGADPTLDPEEGKREVKAQVKRLETLLAEAASEPIHDLPPRQRGKMARRVERVVREMSADWDGQPALKIAMSLYYFLHDLIDREVLILLEGSAMGEAMALMFPMFEHGFEEARMDASAQKQARRLLARLQAEGYYRPLPMAGCAGEAEARAHG